LSEMSALASFSRDESESGSVCDASTSGTSTSVVSPTSLPASGVSPLPRVNKASAEQPDANSQTRQTFARRGRRPVAFARLLGATSRLREGSCFCSERPIGECSTILRELFASRVEVPGDDGAPCRIQQLHFASQVTGQFCSG